MSATHSQTVSYLKPLLRKLKKKVSCQYHLHSVLYIMSCHLLSSCLCVWPSTRLTANLLVYLLS